MARAVGSGGAATGGIPWGGQVELEETLRGADGLLSGHFVLSSGRHADRYLQVAAPFERPEVARRLAGALAAAVLDRGLRPQTVLGPALGAIVPGFALAQAMGLRFIFSERDAEGRMALRRGFRLASGEPVLVCENTLTTGGSVHEVLALIEAAGARVVGVATYCDRTADPGSVFAVPYVSLGRFELTSWDAADCPLCRAGAAAAVKPGSRPGLVG